MGTVTPSFINVGRWEVLVFVICDCSRGVIEYLLSTRNVEFRIGDRLAYKCNLRKHNSEFEIRFPLCEDEIKTIRMNWGTDSKQS